MRAGWAGAIAAFLAFTLPSALLLFLFASVMPQISGTAGGEAIHGLKLVSLTVVAQAALGMAQHLCSDVARAIIAMLAAMVILVSGQAWTRLLIVAVGAVDGLAFCSSAELITVGVGILGTALYYPIWRSAVSGPVDLGIAAVGFAFLTAWRTSAFLVVI